MMERLIGLSPGKLAYGLDELIVLIRHLFLTLRSSNGVAGSHLKKPNKLEVSLISQWLVGS